MRRPHSMPIRRGCSSGRGGNWLVWNVTRKYLKHFDEAGTLHLP